MEVGKNSSLRTPALTLHGWEWCKERKGRKDLSEVSIRGYEGQAHTVMSLETQPNWLKKQRKCISSHSRKVQKSKLPKDASP